MLTKIRATAWGVLSSPCIPIAKRKEMSSTPSRFEFHLEAVAIVPIALWLESTKSVCMDIRNTLMHNLYRYFLKISPSLCTTIIVVAAVWKATESWKFGVRLQKFLVCEGDRFLMKAVVNSLMYSRICPSRLESASSSLIPHTAKTATKSIRKAQFSAGFTLISRRLTYQLNHLATLRPCDRFSW